MRKEKSHRIERLNPNGVFPPQGPYSHLVRITSPKTLIYVAGQVSVDSTGSTVGIGDIKAQTAQVYQNIKIILHSVGATFDNIVEVTTFLVNLQENINGFRRVREKFFAGNRPASALIGVKELVKKEYLVEVKCTVVF